MPLFQVTVDRCVRAVIDRRLLTMSLIGMIATGCAKPASSPVTVPTVVTVSRPVERLVANYADFSGRTAAVDSVEVRARVFGYLDKVNFKEGGPVKKGDVLYEIDPRTYKAALAQAEASLVQAQAKAERLRRDFDRISKLGGAASREEVDRVAGEKAEADASVASAIAARDTARLNLDFTRVVAPIGGHASRTMITAGNLVQSGEAAGGTLLTTIVSGDKMYVYFDVDERTLLLGREVQRANKASADKPDGNRPVFMGLATEDGFPHQGTLDFVDVQLNPKTGTIRVRAIFPNPDGFLTPGLFVRVRIPLGDPHPALLVTDRAIETNQGQKVVYTVNDKNEVVSRPVRLGAIHDGLRAVELGLKADERVIVNGLQRVRPGIVVEPKLVDMPVPPHESPLPAVPAPPAPAAK
ncbi:efflux RND transporter periplasmic adaptor subunit [Limnoglobus roseus]|uniref:MexE family multidrug efflux RND transporter periplasmic adaptor subunit n=1 Tax=Limnoglobus roseus TaxID=2598579 RepID=A0A5C1AKY8_9BACT|nr:efflux RND transporter periplasmic adaptor subunit [Limnoglobus roseus]QEL18392.1 MexE family multidrug efflux RND transporter periplasmic adaptor subunit [Limnoglobus roseus]